MGEGDTGERENWPLIEHQNRPKSSWTRTERQKGSSARGNSYRIIGAKERREVRTAEVVEDILGDDAV